MKLDTWGLPDRLRAAGLAVVETPGWKGRSHGELPNSPTVVWHHDASPKGDSPGALGWMISNYPSASAQIWIDRYGVVHLVGAGIAWHAGKVLEHQEAYDNFHSIGIETDHTTDEDWPPALLHALRLTTAVILDKAKRGRDNFSFHRLICSPVGRKSDPAGLNITAERAAVAAIGSIQVAGASASAPSAPKDDDMPLTDTDIDRIADKVAEKILGNGGGEYVWRRNPDDPNSVVNYRGIVTATLSAAEKAADLRG